MIFSSFLEIDFVELPQNRRTRHIRRLHPNVDIQSIVELTVPRVWDEVSQLGFGSFLGKGY